MDRVAIASNELGMHVLVRTVPKDAGLVDRPKVSMADLNALLSSRKPRELALAVSKLPPLLPLGPDLPRKGSWATGLEDALRVADDLGLGPVDVEILQYESQFDANTSVSMSASASRSAAERMSYSAEWLRGAFDGCDPGAADLVIEPLAEWVFARNVLGIVAKLLALIETTDAPMERAGFAKRENSYLGEEIWYLPFAFNPFFAPTKPSLASIAARFGDYGIYNPLLKLTTRQEQMKRRGGNPIQRQVEEVIANCFGPSPLAGGGAVYLLTAPVASEDYIRLIGGKRAATERRYMLCTSAGDSQQAAARRVANALIDAVASLRSDDGRSEFGWVERRECRFEASPISEFEGCSTLSALMLQIVYRGSNRIAVCSNCGCAILQTQKGPLKEWCSPACRMASVRRVEKERMAKGE